MNEKSNYEELFKALGDPAEYNEGLNVYIYRTGKENPLDYEIPKHPAGVISYVVGPVKYMGKYKSPVELLVVPKVRDNQWVGR
jgi:hypothetical protein